MMINHSTRSLFALLAAALMLAVFALQQATATELAAQGVSADEIADELSPDEFRRYGQESPTRVRTRIGNLEFTEGGFAGGFPTIETADKLHDELDFHRATQAYLWALPIVSFAELLRAHEEIFGAKDGDIVMYKTPQAKRGILTANVTTPYAFSFIDLARTGPYVFEVPEGPSTGVINDMWQRGIEDFGVAGPDAGKGARILLLAPGMELPAGVDSGEYTVIRNPTNIVYFGIRALQPDPQAADALLRSFNIYSYADRGNPPEQVFIEVGKDVSWGGWQPHGMGYWNKLHDILDREVIAERDRLMISMLDSLGLKKGKPFEPDDRQRRVLKEAAVVGEAMAKAITFDKRFDNRGGYADSNWEQVSAVTVDDRDGDMDQMYRRAAWTYEAITRGKAYYVKQAGAGQQYLGVYKDADGEFLAGSRYYTLTMPPNPPAETFWSVVVYDVNTRTPIVNAGWNAVAGSRTGLVANGDGSTTIHFSPEKPAGVKDSNWIQTNAGEGWFAYLRFYGPTQAFFDQSYPLQDIRLVE